MPKDKFLIAITGGLGTGKSLFSKYLLEKNEVVINSDQVAKKIMTTKSIVKEQIIKLIGNQAYLNDNELNTKFIASQIFTDPELYKKFNKIVHPPTIVEIQRLAQKEFNKRNRKRVFVESALVFEASIEKKFDLIVLLKSDLNLRLKRTIERDKTTPDEFYQRIQYQIDPDIAEEHSDFVIYNNGTLEELHKRFEFIYNLIKMITENKK
ncbi:MAG: dephospho-CoA kinase [Ignavibacteria bacterium]|nr:dephospho-CoA kinase [Ignavibacteria bacterium]